MLVKTQLLWRMIVVLTMVMSLAAAMPLAGSAQGNSDAAHACQQGGYASWVRDNGTSFKNTGQCVSYAAHGRRLINVQTFAQCGGNGYLDWRTTERGRFSSSNECYDYVDSGGVLQAPYPYTIINVVSTTGTSCTVQAGFRDFPVGESFTFTVAPALPGLWTGGAGAPYGDSGTGYLSLDPGETLRVDVGRPDYGPQADASYTCQAPST